MAENADPNKTLRFADSPAGPSGLPPKTPGAPTSKKRKRSAASVAHDRDVNSKKCKTYKIYQLLLYCNWIKDVDDLDGLCKNIDEAKSAIERFDETVDAKVQALTGPWIQKSKEIDAAKLKATADCKKRVAACQLEYANLLVKMLRMQALFTEAQAMRADAAEAKLAAVEERDRWSEKIRELSKVQEEKDRYYAEVLELRKLKYAADRKAKGPVGVAR